MKYELNGKNINIPDKDIENFIKKYGLSREDAVQLWLEDNDYIENEVVNELMEKTKGQRHYEKSGKERKPTTRERKVDEEKKRFLLDMKTLIEGLGGNVTGIKNEAEFSYTYGENSYTVKLVKHRPPKKDA
mgnify:CR=1 FL=1